MAKIPARREPARTATPKELAEESKRSEEARLPKPGSVDFINDRVEDLEDDVNAYERRLRALEQMLDPDATYTFDRDSDEGVPLQTLWDSTHNRDGSRRAKGRELGNGEVIDDLMTGALRPKTWAELCDTVQVLGEYHVERIRDVLDLQDGRRPLAELVANLHKAIMAPSGRSAEDIADAFVLETRSGLVAHQEIEWASEVANCWDLIKLYRSRDGNAIAEYKKHHRLVSFDFYGNPIEVDD